MCSPPFFIFYCVEYSGSLLCVVFRSFLFCFLYGIECTVLGVVLEVFV